MKTTDKSGDNGAARKVQYNSSDVYFLKKKWFN